MNEVRWEEEEVVEVTVDNDNVLSEVRDKVCFSYPKKVEVSLFISSIKTHMGRKSATIA